MKPTIETIKKACIAIIPARYASTRFPAKPLADMLGKPMIQRVYERVASVLPKVLIATDDSRIYEAVRAFGGDVMMTDVELKSGTERCWQAYERLAATESYVINLQGDEPFILQEQIEMLLSAFCDPTVDIATLCHPYPSRTSFEELSNPNSPKLVRAADGSALYFSRSVIPYLRAVEPDEWATNHRYLKHIGIYAFRAEALRRAVSIEASPLAQAESLEQLAWLEAGMRIRVLETEQASIGIDTPEDLQKAIAFMQSEKLG